jgi:ABC-type maltose transport system permease subunit
MIDRVEIMKIIIEIVIRIVRGRIAVIIVNKFVSVSVELIVILHSGRYGPFVSIYKIIMIDIIIIVSSCYHRFLGGIEFVR